MRTTGTAIDALLLAGLGSPASLITLAELLTLPRAVGVTVIVAFAVAPLATVPREQVTVPLALEQFAEAETKVNVDGSVSVARTPVASSGPPFVTVSVYTRLAERKTGFGAAEIPIERSADCVVAMTVAVASLSAGVGSFGQGA
jgi:hypothetical protein